LGFSKSAIQAIQKAGTPGEVSAGDLLIEEGVFDETLYYLESGKVEILRGGEVVDTISSGDVFGEVAFVEKRPRTASVRAMESCSFVAVQRQDLLRSLAEDSEALFNFVHAIEERRNAHMESHDGQEVDAFLEGVATEATSHRAVHHPYLLALRDRSLPDMKWALADFARQYLGYSSHFPRYLTTVIGRLEVPEHRSALMENLTEESGIYESEEMEELAEIGVEQEWIDGIPHPVLFRRFCLAAGVDQESLSEDAVEVVCWREMFLGVLSGGSTAEALGALGLGTENVVSTMYQHFLPALEVLEVPPSETVFFPLHAAVDDHHQETLMEISKHYAATSEGRRDLLKGMRKALTLRAGFWDWLHARALTKGQSDEGATQIL
jgi:CRP-like cAMP-binding protein